MKIIRADHAGFCFGVERAIKKALRAGKDHPERPVYTLGPVVHNPRVVENLEKEGIKAVEDLESNPPGVLIIRSHGVAPGLRAMSEEMGYTVIDATCPLVQKIHNFVIRLDEQGYAVIIIGHKGHPEITGIAGEIKGKHYIIDSVEKAKGLPDFNKAGVVVQTTALEPLFEEIACVLIKKARELRIYNTICGATSKRQQAAEKLASETDAMIIVGGKNSSNTRRLLEMCLSVNPRSYQVESAEEVKTEWLEGVKHVGVTAGASTPEESIDEVVRVLEDL